jgi:4-hydroxy-tetrahydrodipicolinate synthase
MQKTKHFHGVVIPMVTPFTKDGKIDRESTEVLINYIIEAGTFPFILGTTGEANSMTMELRREFVKTVSKCLAQRKTLYVGIAENCLETSILTAKLYHDLGADAFVAHPPFYYPLNEDHLLRYFETLAEKLPKPLIIYNIPSTTHISLSLELIEKLSKHPNIVGLKDSERSLERIAVFSQKFSTNQEFSLLSGWTVKSVFALQSGFDGIVPSTGNIVPKLFQELYLTSKNGSDHSQELQEVIIPIADIHQKDKLLSQVIPALKIMLNEKGLCLPHVLPPLVESTESDVKQIRDEMDRLQIDKYI